MPVAVVGGEEGGVPIDPQDEGLKAKFMGLLSKGTAGIEAVGEEVAAVLQHQPESAPQAMALLLNSAVAARPLLPKTETPESVFTQAACAAIRRAGSKHLLTVQRGIAQMQPDWLRRDAQAIDKESLAERIGNANKGGALDPKLAAQRGALLDSSRALLGPVGAGSFSGRLLGGGSAQPAPQKEATGAIAAEDSEKLEMSGLPTTPTTYAMAAKSGNHSDNVQYVRTAVETGTLKELVGVLSRAADYLFTQEKTGKDPADALRIIVEPALKEADLSEPLMAALRSTAGAPTELCKRMAAQEQRQRGDADSAKKAFIKRLLPEDTQAPDNFVLRMLAILPKPIEKMAADIPLIQKTARFILTGDPEAPPEEVKKVYRRLSVDYHPDKAALKGGKHAEIAGKITKMVGFLNGVAEDGTGWESFSGEMQKAKGELGGANPIYFEPLGDDAAAAPQAAQLPDNLRLASEKLKIAKGQPPEEAKRTFAEIVGMLITHVADLSRKSAETDAVLRELKNALEPKQA